MNTLFTTTSSNNSYELVTKPGSSKERQLRFIVDGNYRNVEKATLNHMARSYRSYPGFIPVEIKPYPDYTGSQTLIVFRGNVKDGEAVKAYLEMLDNYQFPVIDSEPEIGEEQYAGLEGVWASSRECELRSTFSEAELRYALTTLVPDIGEIDIEKADVQTYRSVQRVRQPVIERQTIVTLSYEQAQNLVTATKGSDNLPGSAFMEALLEKHNELTPRSSATQVVNLVVDGNSRKIRAYSQS